MSLKVGDQVYVVRGWGVLAHYIASKVVKVTPTGMVDLLVGQDDKPTRFTPRGHQRGYSYTNYRLDKMPFAKRTVEVARTERLQETATALSEVSVLPAWKWRSDEESIRAEIARLRDLLDKAAAALDRVRGVKTDSGAEKPEEPA